MNPTSRYLHIGITIQHLQSASIGLKLRILSDGGLLSGMIEYGRNLQQ
jgi:hypothetical protein